MVEMALAEDVGSGDVTTESTISEAAMGQARMMAREELVVAGLELAEETFRRLSERVVVERCVDDGTRVAAGDCLMKVEGPVRALLTGERVALNFVQRMSGVATLTARFVAAVAGTVAKILDTRKTIPGWRMLDKYAVRCGGGENHRTGLYDMVLIKDNHLASLKDELPSAIAAAVRRARQKYPELKVEVEADTLEQALQAQDAGADIILLDNMSAEQLREVVARLGGKTRTEASGGVTLETVRAIAESGVDYVSVGALTHSARAVDIGLDFVEEKLG